MKKLLSTTYSDNAFNFAMLVQRAVTGLLLLINYGLPKISNFSTVGANFYDPFSIGHRNSLMLSLFAEIFCSMLLVLGLFTRIAAFIILVNMAIAVFMFHKNDPLKTIGVPLMFLSSVFTLLLVGPGRVSVDGMMAK